MTDRSARAQALVRRQAILTVAALLLVAAALALLHWHAVDGGTRYSSFVADGRTHVRVVHHRPGAFAMRLAVAELVLCGALVLGAVVHAARVIAFVFPGEVR